MSRPKVNGKKDNPMAELRAHAQAAQRELKQGAGYVGWTDLDDGNFCVFNIKDGYEHTKEVKKEGGFPMKFQVFATPKYKLFDIDGNLIREGDISKEDDQSEENYYHMPSKEKMYEKIRAALEEGMVVCMMTAHELVKHWTPPGATKPLPFHKADLTFHSADSSNYKVLYND